MKKFLILSFIATLFGIAFDTPTSAILPQDTPQCNQTTVNTIYDYIKTEIPSVEANGYSHVLIQYNNDGSNFYFFAYDAYNGAYWDMPNSNEHNLVVPTIIYQTQYTARYTFTSAGSYITKTAINPQTWSFENSAHNKIYCVDLAKNNKYNSNWIDQQFTSFPPDIPIDPIEGYNPNMLYRDVSNIPDDHLCYAIRDDKTIISYDSTNSYTYTLLADKYYLHSTTVESQPSSINCYNYEQIQLLKSPYDFIAPILHIIAIVSVLMLIYFAYKLIIYPFYRSKI